MHHLALPLLIALALLLVAAAAGDVRTRTIPNGLNLAIALMALPWWLAMGLGWQEIAWQAGIAAILLVAFGACFAIGMMGGGDVKLIVALALWLPFPRLMTMLWWMAIAGGVLTLALMLRHRLARAAAPLEVPYGVAIVAACLPLVANDILTLVGP